VGSIRAGSAIEPVLKKYAKGRVTRHERFITVEMGNVPIHAGIILMALDGKLVFACDSDLRPPHIFFQVLTDAELRAALRSYETECDRVWRARNAAFAAVLGVAVNIHGDEEYLYCPPLPE
jgi:hypothetical protein